MNNIQLISDSYLCSACGACNAVCSKDAISFKYTNIGRKYASVDNCRCVNCGICQKVCPSLDSLNLHKKFNDPFVGNVINTYVGHATNEFIYKNAQSGGLCTAILCYLFESGKIDGAIVCRMSYGKTPLVEGILAETKEQVLDCQKSCYTPVDVLSALKQAKDKKSIAVVGLPCHIQGAVHLIETLKKFSNIKYRIGLICDRTLCAGIMDVMSSYSDESENLIRWRLKDFTYNEQYYPYKSAPVVLESRNKRYKVMPNLYRVVLKDMFTAPRCRICYDKLCTHADLVLGDPWGMSGIDWKRGDSLVLTRTKCGENLIQEIVDKEIANLREGNFKDVLNGQKINVKRDSVGGYSQALATKIECKESYLLYYNNKASFGKQTKEIADFIDIESKQKSYIVDLARKKIYFTLIMNERKKNLFWKIYYKLNKFFK